MRLSEVKSTRNNAVIQILAPTEGDSPSGMRVQCLSEELEAIPAPYVMAISEPIVSQLRALSSEKMRYEFLCRSRE